MELPNFQEFPNIGKQELSIEDLTIRKHGKRFVLHAVEVMAALENMREESTACDFTVKVGRLEFPVHRAVLVACSKYFRAMFGSFMKESIEGVVELHDVEENSVRECIKFMYGGDSSDLTSESAIEVLHTAAVLQLDKLRAICFSFLKQNISPQNCLTLLNLSDLYEAEELRVAARKYFLENFQAVTEDSEFLQLPKDDALMYILEYGSSDDLIFGATAAWIEWDIKARTDEAIDFFNMLSLDEFPSNYLINSLWKAEFFQESELCKDHMCKFVFSDVAKLSEHLCMSNWFVLYSMAEYYEHIVQEIHDEICRFMLRNFTLVVNDNDFCNVSKIDVISMFKSPQAVYFSSEKLKWKATLKWMRRNKDADSSVFCKLLESIGLRQLSKRFLMDAINGEPLIRDYPSSQAVLETAVRQSSMLTEDNAIAFVSEDSAIDILHLKGQKWMHLHHTALHDLKITCMNGHLCILDGKDLYIVREGACVKQTSLSKLPQRDGRAIGLNDKLYLVCNTHFLTFDSLSNSWDEECFIPATVGDDKLFPVGVRGKIYLISSSPSYWLSTVNGTAKDIFEGVYIPSDIDCQISDTTTSVFCAGFIYIKGKSREIASDMKIAKYCITNKSWKLIAVPDNIFHTFKLFAFKNCLYAHHNKFGNQDEFLTYNDEWDEWSRIMKSIPRRSLSVGKDVESICAFTS